MTEVRDIQQLSSEVARVLDSNAARGNHESIAHIVGALSRMHGVAAGTSADPLIEAARRERTEQANKGMLEALRAGDTQTLGGMIGRILRGHAMAHGMSEEMSSLFEILKNEADLSIGRELELAVLSIKNSLKAKLLYGVNALAETVATSADSILSGLKDRSGI